MGYMGHMTLIADEVVKLFEHFPEEIYAVVEPHIPQPDWDRYVATTLRETRERDLSPLGGGIQMGTHSASIVSGLSDEDDEFPLAAPRRPADTSALSGGASESSNSPVRRRTDSLEDASTGDKVRLPHPFPSCFIAHIFSLLNVVFPVPSQRDFWRSTRLLRRRRGTGQWMARLLAFRSNHVLVCFESNR